jgi:hypothetical protein
MRVRSLLVFAASLMVAVHMYAAPQIPRALELDREIWTEA